MKFSLVVIFFTLFFLGCSESSLKMDNNHKLVLKHDSHSTFISQGVLKKQLISFKDMNLQRYIVNDSFGNNYFFEEIIADNDYEIKSNTIDVFKMIFHVNRVNIIHSSSNLLIIQLERDYDYINLIAHVGDVEKLAYVYGMSNEYLVSIAKSVGVNVHALKVKDSLKYVGHQTEFKQIDLILNPIVEAQTGWGGF